MVYPKTSTQVDYEVELAAIIGKRGKDIAESDAFDHIAGYTVFNDISARDIQFADKQWFREKASTHSHPRALPWSSANK